MKINKIDSEKYFVYYFWRNKLITALINGIFFAALVLIKITNLAVKRNYGFERNLRYAVQLVVRNFISNTYN